MLQNIYTVLAIIGICHSKQRDIFCEYKYSLYITAAMLWDNPFHYTLSWAVIYSSAPPLHFIVGSNLLRGPHYTLSWAETYSVGPTITLYCGQSLTLWAPSLYFIVGRNLLCGPQQSPHSNPSRAGLKSSYTGTALPQNTCKIITNYTWNHWTVFNFFNIYILYI